MQSSKSHQNKVFAAHYTNIQWHNISTLNQKYTSIINFIIYIQKKSYIALIACVEKLNDSTDLM